MKPLSFGYLYRNYAARHPSLTDMFFIIHALDKPGQTQTTLDNYADHKSYLSSASIKTIVSGPLLDDDGVTMIGSFFLLEADSKEEVIRFNANDPFGRIGLWQSVSINAFNKRVDIVAMQSAFESRRE
jgi:uncharacterized protein YciI